MRRIRHVAIGAAALVAVIPVLTLAGHAAAGQEPPAAAAPAGDPKPQAPPPAALVVDPLPVPVAEPVPAEAAATEVAAAEAEAQPADTPAVPEEPVLPEAPVEAPPPPPPVDPYTAAGIVREAFARFGPEVQDQAVRIAVCESHLDAGAVGFNRDGNAGRHDLGRHSSDWGIMQINSHWNLDRYLPADSVDYVAALDPHWNAQVASDIYARGGWQLWSTAPYALDEAAYEAHC